MAFVPLDVPLSLLYLAFVRIDFKALELQNLVAIKTKQLYGIPRDLGPIHTIQDSSHIGLLPISDRPSIHTILDECDMLRIAFAE